jgi:pyruvate/2-oxoglutarate dehydrogenase complex dihydrolipoamide dehydrogenase (E3) component
VPDVEKYEILVFGSGEAGKYLAWTMAKAGHGTQMVERTPNTRGIGLDQAGVKLNGRGYIKVNERL